MDKKRREIIKKAGLGTLALGAFGTGILSSCGGSTESKEAVNDEAVEMNPAVTPWFNISLAQWSLHKTIYGEITLDWQALGKALKEDTSSVLNGTLDPLDFATMARNEFDIDAIEYVNQFYMDKAENMEYLAQLKDRADSAGVKSVLIMCDAEGDLGNLNEAERIKAVENHYKWVNAAKYLGCHSIRVNAAGNGTADEVRQAAVDGLGRLTEYGAKEGIHVIVENHGGHSSDGQWLSGVIKEVNSPYCGTLPDFGNFCLEYGQNYSCNKEYDKYKGVEELMPFAQGVSAKSHAFDQQGNEAAIDYDKMMSIVKDAGFKGYVGIEYEGSELGEVEGIKATKALLEKYRV
jgi:sugar phosphate isomerase/epimerase